MRTKIDLGSSGIIDLTDDVSYAITYAIADIRNPEKRNASYSKTIRIPGSPNNDYKFRFIFEIDIDCNFNPNLKAPCVLVVDDMPQLTGYLQLLKIYRLENKIEYEVVIIGQLGNIFTEWGEKYLSDLDYSDLNHYFLKSVQIPTWTADVGTRYVYPMIDLGNGYNGMRYAVEDFYPAIYVKEYIDRMFSLAGYTYSSTIFNSDFFKRLIIPTNKQLGLKLGDITPRIFSASNLFSDTYNYSLTSSAYTTAISTVYNFSQALVNGSGAFNVATNKWTVPISGVYNLVYGGEIARVNTDYATLRIKIILKRGGVYSVLGMSVTHVGTSDVTINPITTMNVNLIMGDVLYLGIEAISVGVASNTLTIAGDENADFRDEVGVYTTTEGMLVDMNYAIPEQIKIKDFFTSIIKMFNLYIEQDKNQPNLLLIDPRNEFYSSGVVVDWSAKLDMMQDLEIFPMGELDAVKYKFTYKEDSDYWNTKYKNAWQKVYAEENYIVTNDFLKAENTTELIFSPSPQVNVYGLDRIIPQIINIDNVGNIERQKDFNIRILYYGGVKTTATAWSYESVIEGNTLLTTYPYCGMVDDVDTPDVMLDFGVPIEVFYDTNVYSNNNLFNKYYKQFIEEITDKDSKIVTGLFALTPLDILKLDFRNEFYINGNLYRLNKIYDYNPIAETLTKCEFIKIKHANSFVKKRVIGTGVDSVFSPDNPLPRPSRPFLPIVTSVISPDNLIHPSVIGAVVTGTGNVIGAGVENPTILGSSGVIIASGVRSPIVIGTNNILVDRSNAVIVNGVDLTASSGIVTNGTYTPTIYNIHNVSSSTALVCNYSRNGSMVVVSGCVRITVTAISGNTQFEISLPITTAMTAISQASGTGTEETGLYSASIQANTALPRVTFRMLPATNGNMVIFFIFQYQIV